jgi:hypothetical protein
MLDHATVPGEHADRDLEFVVVRDVDPEHCVEVQRDTIDLLQRKLSKKRGVADQSGWADPANKTVHRFALRRRFQIARS